MIIVDKMFSVYIGLFLSVVVLGAEVSVNTSDSKYHIIPNIIKSISDRFMSFSVETCGSAYIGLSNGITDSDYIYKIAIDEYYNMTWDLKFIIRSYIRIGRDIVTTKSYQKFKDVLDCNNNKEFYITWNDSTITIGLGLEVNGPLLLTWTSSSYLRSILNVGIRTPFFTGKWIFYTSEDTPTMTEEATPWPKQAITRDFLLSTDVKRYPLSTLTKNMSTISQGTSIRSQTYTSTEKLNIHNETADLPWTTRPEDRTTTSNDLQSRTTNEDSAIINYASASTSTESATITKPSPISTSEISPCGEQCTPTCTCSCPKVSVTPSSNVLVVQLKIDRKTLSSYKRRQTSATDPRKSSFYIGYVGITVFSVIVGFMVLLDFLPRA